MTLGRKLAVTNIALLGSVVLVLIVLVTDGFKTLWHRAEEEAKTAMGQAVILQLETRGRTLAPILADALRDAIYHRDLATIERTVAALKADRDISVVQVFDAAGRLLHDGDPELRQYGQLLEDPVVRNSLVHRGITVSNEAGSLMVAAPVFMGGELAGGIHFHLSTSVIHTEFQRIAARFADIVGEGMERAALHIILAATGLFSLGSLLALWAGHRMAKPIEALAVAAGRIGHGEWNVQLPKAGADEVGELVKAIETMMADLRGTTVSRAYLDRIVTNLREGLIVLSADGRIEAVNPATCQMLGYPEDQLVGRSMTELVEGGDWPTLRGRGEAVFVREDGSSFTADFLDARLPDTEGGGAIVTFRDVSERKQAEKLLQERTEALERSNAELEQFAYLASHDLQEPLRIIVSYTQLLERRYADKLDADGREFIAFAVDGAKRMQRLVMDLLDYSRVDRHPLDRQAVDCRLLLGQLLEEMDGQIREAQAEITVGPLPTLIADRFLLARVFRNVLGNALKYRRPDCPPRILVGAERASDGWIISVADNGIGIAEEYRDRVFDIFRRLHTQAEYPGTGVGLAIAKKAVEHHGGRIWVEGNDAGGSTFRFHLPSRPRGA